MSRDEEQLLRVDRTNELTDVLKARKMSNVAMIKSSLSIAANVMSVVGIVMVNKIIFSRFHYPFGTR